MRIARVATIIAIVLSGPVLGILGGFVLGMCLLPADTANTGRAPGDGFMIIGCIALGLFVFVPLSVIGALALALRSPSVLNRSVD
jgi:hypothetical protein